MARPSPLPPLTDTPLDAAGRLHALDILRGFALLGMILVHFHQRMLLPVEGAEDLIGWFVWVGVEQKAWGTFAFLFGVGFAVLLRRLEARGIRVVPVYLRRLAALAAFGLVAEIGFGFHVLVDYALWGVPLLFLRHLSARGLLAAALVAAAVRPLVFAAAALIAAATGGEPLAAASPGAVAARQAVYAAQLQADWATLAVARAAAIPFRYDLLSWRFWLPGPDLALFILGMLALRVGVFDAPRRRVRIIGAAMVFGAVAWAVSWLVLQQLPATGVPGLDWPLAYGLGIVREQWLCLTYIGGVVLLLAYRPVWERRLAWAGLAGRMALTNFMLQAAALDALGSAYGAGLRLRPLHYVAATGLFFAAEVALSRAWLTRYRYGPLEWLWRRVTYARSGRPTIYPAARGAH